MFLEDPGLYYEIHGQGTPLVLINGIMMNTLSWVDHIGKLKDRFQLIVYDMRDQGQSRRLAEGYDISIHADDLEKLLNHLNIRKAQLLGLSYGGMVALYFALKSPDRIEKLVLSNTTAYTDQYLRSLGQMWIKAASTYDGEAFFHLALVPIYSRSFYNTRYDWLESRKQLFKDFLTREWFDGFIRLASSNSTTDLREEISRITLPTLLIAANEDIITPYSQMAEIHRAMVNSQLVCIPESGHAAFLEKIDLFCALLKGFLA